MSRFLSRCVLLASLAAVAVGLSACVVYETPPTYYRPAYGYSYSPPPAVYVYEPAPSYYHHHHHHDWR